MCVRESERERERASDSERAREREKGRERLIVLHCLILQVKLVVKLLALSYMCPHTAHPAPHTAIYVSACSYLSIRTLLHMCPHTAHPVPHTAVYVSACSYMRIRTLLHESAYGPSSTAYSSYHYFCVLIRLIQYRILLYMCVRMPFMRVLTRLPHATTCVSSTALILLI